MFKKHTALPLAALIKKHALLPLAALIKKCALLPLAALVKKHALLPLAAMDRSERDSLLSFCSSCKKSFGLLPGQAGATISSHT
ncbi:hypothetical protein G3164_004493 [Salmonella enterica subsp. enterica serovar Montevideo]|nr:hypothetical protein [Salmonella enterica subsp. enterica serovar Montevideo]EEK7813001.1 hypothetical protein [Salmonella enterica subsp. enterica serovar Montevideo]EEL0142963.1 hypothetical protein [Salmonella enterica subsp. enterica serovar Montevideo]